MSAQVEAITARDLFDWLTRQGCTVVRRNGSHATLITGHGAKIKVPEQRSGHIVTTACLREVARAFGCNLHDFRVRLGMRAPATGKPPKPKNPPVKAKPDKVESVDQLALRVRDLAEQIYRSGPCRRADYDARKQLRAVTLRLERWLNDQVAAA